MKDVLLLISGAFLGLGLSVLWWWLTTHRIIPKIEFSEGVQKFYRPDGSFTHRIKFMNTGRRDAIDLAVQVRLGLFELGAPRTWNWYIIPTQTDSIPELRSGGNRLLLLRPSMSSRFKEALFSKDIHDRCDDGSLTVEDLLPLGTKSVLITYIFAYDSVSGARKLYKSKIFSSDDIFEGRFKKLDIIKGRESAQETDVEETIELTS